MSTEFTQNMYLSNNLYKKYLPGHADEEADLQDFNGDFANRGISFFFKILKS